MKSPCKNCGGVCCRWYTAYFKGPIELYQDNEWMNKRGVLDPVSGRITAHHVRSTCPSLDENGRCTVRESRPADCKSYEPGGTDCRAIRKVDREHKERKCKEDSK